MLFNKDHPKICALCLYGEDYSEDTILCSKKGPVDYQGHCSKFQYDPLRRKPASGAVMRKVKDQSAFEL